MDTQLRSQLSNFSFNEETLQDYAKIVLICEILWRLFYFFLNLFLFITSFLGFGFYLWFLSTSDGQTQTRLLNILNGYMAGTCMGLSPMLFIMFYVNDEIFELCFIITAPFIIAIPITFLLISFATILNHFKPDAYLVLSLHWKHKIMIPILLFFLILTEQLANHSCPKENFMECEASTIKRFLFIPANVTSFLCQLIVIVDVIFGWKNIYRTLRGLFRPTNVVGYINVHQIRSLQASASHLPIHPNQQLDQHLKLISLTTGFLTFSLFNMIIFIISLLGVLLENSWKTGRHGNLPWLVAMAFTSTIWIVRNRNMMEKINKFRII